MADTISAFFTSLFSDPKERRAPTRLTSESRTVGSAAPPKPTAGPAGAANQTLEASGDAASGSAEPGGVSREDVRNLRDEFLNKKFGAPGKAKGSATGTKTHTKAQSPPKHEA